MHLLIATLTSFGIYDTGIIEYERESKAVKHLVKHILLGSTVFAGAVPAIALAQSNAPADQIPAILSDKAVMAEHPLPDYSYAGYGFGVGVIPTDPGTVINVTDHGAVPDDGKDDAKAILKALAAADAMKGRVTIRFPKGRIQIGEIIPIERSELILDGAGEGKGGTEFYFPRPKKFARGGLSCQV